MKLKDNILKLCRDKDYIAYSEQGIFDWNFLTWIEKLELARLEMSWSENVYLTNKNLNPELFNYLKSLGTFRWKNLKYKIQYKFTDKYIDFNHRDVQLNLLRRILEVRKFKSDNPSADASDLRRILMFNLRLMQMDNNRDLLNELTIEPEWFRDALITAPYWSIKFLDFMTDKYMRYLSHKNNILVNLIFEDYDK